MVMDAFCIMSRAVDSAAQSARSLKLIHSRHHYGLQEYSFTVQVVNLWNSLPEYVISANTIN